METAQSKESGINSKIKKLSGSILWPPLLSALVAPGVGQFFNREYIKGSVLIFTFFASFYWIARVTFQALSLIMQGPPDQWQTDPVALNAAITKVVNQDPVMFNTFNLLILIVWVFGIVDAYMSAKQRKKRLESAQLSHETPHIDS